MLEETLVRNVKTLQYLLDGLAVQQVTTNAFREMGLHLRTGNEFPVQGVVSLLQRKGVVPHETGFTEHRVQLCRPFASIQFVRVCHHILKSLDLLQIYRKYLRI